ncbi:MAG: protein kinase [Armatimonadota bacterium]|jgi:serine/threonine protein kinase
MISGRAILTIILIAAIVWIGVLTVRAGFQPAGVCHSLGVAVGKTGLRGIGTTLLEASVAVYRGKLEAAEHAKAPAEELTQNRRAVLDAELAVARAYLRSGKPLKTKEHLEAARKLEHDNPALLVLLSEARMELGEQDDAKLGLLRVHAADEKNARAAYLLGRLFEAEGKQEDAISWYERAVGADPDTVSAQLALAEALHARGSSEEAKEHAMAAVASAGTVGEKIAAVKAAGRIGAKVRSPSLEVLTIGAHRHWKAGIAAAACVIVFFAPALLAAASKVVRIPVAYLCLVVDHRSPRALSLYRYLLGRRPGAVRALRILAQEELGSNPSGGQALELCERWYDHCPQDPEAAASFAQIAISGGRQDEKAARACQAWYEQGIEDPHGRQQAAAFLCEAYLATEAMDEHAVPVCELAVLHQPDRHELVRYLGALYNRFGRSEDAQRTLARAMELAPDDPETTRLLAAASIANGQYYVAYRHLLHLPSTDEVDSTMYVAGVGSEQDGDVSAALRIFSEVARREPSFADVQYRIQRLSPVADQAVCGDFALQFVIGESPAYKICAARRGEELYALCVFERDCSDMVAFPHAFARDVAVLMGLEHDVLPRVVEHGESAEQYYVATEAVAGKTVRALLEEREKLSLKESAVVVGEVLRALAHLHSRGLVHGDVSPENVMVGSDGQVKLLGTGLTLIAGKSVGEERAPHVHSPECVAPEIVQKQPASPASDIYATGALLSHMLLGQPVFEGANALAVMMSHVASKPTVPSEVDESLFADIDAVIMRALEKAPEARHGSADAFRAGLLQAAGLTDAARAVTLRVVSKPHTLGEDGEWWAHFDNVSLTSLAWGAKVYRAVLQRDNRPCAVKELVMSRAVDSGAHGRAAAEARRASQRLFQNEVHLLQHIAANMPHKGIVAVSDAWLQEDGHAGAYCMELLSHSLADRVVGGPVEEQEATDIVAAICDAVGHLHEHGVAHRHLSPSAVMFDAEGGVRLVGFDRACRLQDKRALMSAEVALQAASGTPAEALGDVTYAAPEQCRAEDFDERADVYAIGGLLFALLTGHPPFQADDPVALMLKHLSEPPPRLETLGISAHSSVQVFLDKALSKAPEERFPDANAARDALQRQAPVPAGADDAQPARYRIQV